MGTLTVPAIVSMALVITGLAIKSGLFPFHFWMPDAYGCATPTSSSLLSGMVTKGYILLLIKVIYRMFTYEVLAQTEILTILFVLGVIAMVVGRGDYIICDDRDHASIIDGRRLSFARQLHYKHNDMEDLENVLKKLPYDAVKLIVVDGVFSMEGDLCKLPEIVELKKKYNCSIMVDEAHGVGVFGRQGRGVCDYFGLTDEVDLIMGTFSKSLASIGGFIAGDSDTINFLRHTSRTYIFSASNTPAATAAAMEALHILKSEPQILENLWKVTKYALKRFREEGFEIGETESPIIPLYVHDVDKTFLVTKLAYDAGVFINPVIPPACAPQDTLVRFALMSNHTEEQVERGVMILKKIFVEQNIIK
jgi:7-keto-8-aminopelargonate synthetase-like enzyme